jgi:hypothetical protein
MSSTNVFHMRIIFLFLKNIKNGRAATIYGLSCNPQLNEALKCYTKLHTVARNEVHSGSRQSVRSEYITLLRNHFCACIDNTRQFKHEIPVDNNADEFAWEEACQICPAAQLM